jgi:hypothetical protein
MNKIKDELAEWMPAPVIGCGSKASPISPVKKSKQIEQAGAAAAPEKMQLATATATSDSDSDLQYEQLEHEKMVMVQRQGCRQMETEKMHCCLTEGRRLRAERLAAEGRTEREEAEEIAARLRLHYAVGGGVGHLAPMPTLLCTGDLPPLDDEDDARREEELRRSCESWFRYSRAREVALQGADCEEAQAEKGAKEKVELQVRRRRPTSPFRLRSNFFSFSVLTLTARARTRSENVNATDTRERSHALVLALAFLYARSRLMHVSVCLQRHPIDSDSDSDSANLHLCPPSSRSECAKETRKFNATFLRLDASIREAIRNEERFKQSRELRRKKAAEFNATFRSIYLSVREAIRNEEERNQGQE